MNRQFVVKMLQAKQLEYQALKEIIPEPVVNRIEKLELELVEIAKEYFYEAMSSKASESQPSSNESNVAHERNASNSSRITHEKTKTKKVTIE